MVNTSKPEPESSCINYGGAHTRRNFSAPITLLVNFLIVCRVFSGSINFETSHRLLTKRALRKTARAASVFRSEWQGSANILIGGRWPKSVEEGDPGISSRN